MTEYSSKQVQIKQSDKVIYELLSNFSNFTPIVADKVEAWEATEDLCSFKTHGFAIKLKFEDRVPHKTIKLAGIDLPFEFYFWVQLHSVAENDTRMKLTIHAKLNMLMKTMLGSKLQSSLDKLAESISTAINARGV